MNYNLKHRKKSSVMVMWLTEKAGDLGSIPGQVFEFFVISLF